MLLPKIAKPRQKPFESFSHPIRVKFFALPKHPTTGSVLNVNAFNLKPWSLVLLLALVCALDAGCSDAPSQNSTPKSEPNINYLDFGEVAALAEAGNVEAQYNLALRYDAGIGTTKDSERAWEWFRKSADGGFIPAKVSLAWRLGQGETTLERQREAFELYLVAAKSGNLEAQFLVGECYRDGKGTGRDQREAIRWLRAAADQGLAIAQYNLGVAYDQGNGVSANPVKAAEYYRKAAEQGHKLAQYNLGASYGNGQGVIPSDVQAFYWFSLAAAQGHEGAAQNCEVLAGSMDSEQLSEARSLVAEFKAKETPKKVSNGTPARF